MEASIRKTVSRIAEELSGCEPSVFLYGSASIGDFRLGWSDIDILVLTKKRIGDAEAERLVRLRQTLLEEEPGNPYYRSFEGGMLTLGAFVGKLPDTVVYWGTSGERITDGYRFDVFSMCELIESGIPCIAARGRKGGSNVAAAICNALLYLADKKL